MEGRDPREAHRTSTPLELLFDLAFVVAVSQAATQLSRSLTVDRIGAGLLCYAMVFFAIWWAWMNFTWFASAYDTDDVLYRLLTLLQIAGVLVLAAGVPSAFRHYNFTTITLGYVVMRIAMIAQWLRAAKEHPAGRATARQYAFGVAIIQLAWVARLLLMRPWDDIGFGLLVAAELAVPAWAENTHVTNWHHTHIVDRYGGFTIIVLGEVMLATLASLHDALARQGLSSSLLLIASGGLLLVFGLWWLYFSGQEARLKSLRGALFWGYGHYFVFAAVAALGAGLRVALDVAMHKASIGPSTAAWAVAIPVVVVLVALALLHRVDATARWRDMFPSLLGAISLVLLASYAPTMGIVSMVMGLVVAATVAVKIILDP